jgi:HK97 gp10 family phage protein
MPSQRVEIRWVNEAAWRKAIALHFAEWETQIAANAEKLANLAQREAKARAPVRTGRLRAGIEGSVDHGGESVTVVLSADVLYAPFQEFGTRHMRAHPYMRPGMAAAVAEYTRVVREGLE